MSDDVEEAAPVSERLRIAAIEVGGLPGLGGQVRLDMSPRCTVLVGRNGVGKSLLLQGVSGACNAAVNLLPLDLPVPGTFSCELDRNGQPFVRYEFTKSDKRGLALDFRTQAASRPPGLDERCWATGGTGRRLLWETKDGFVMLPDGRRIHAPAGRLQVGDDWPGLPTGDAERALRTRLHATVVYAGVPREAFAGHGEVLIRTSGVPPREVDTSDAPGHGPRLFVLAWSIISAHEHSADAFRTLEQMGRRVGLFRELRVEIKPFPRKVDDELPDLAAVLVDGQNLGLCSDGTLRVLETLVALLMEPGTLLLLEEPETGIHPGLLEGLLHEIEAYASGSQVLISTHSMQVVSWARPDEIRLVERAEGRTTVRSLDPKDLVFLRDYLAQEGTLGEYVFGGLLDE